MDPAVDLEALRASRLDLARRLLQRHGTFHPFAGAIGADGAVITVGAEADGDVPPSPGLAALLVRGLRERAAEGTIRAAGLCLDVRGVAAGDTGLSDAIAASMEHVRGDAVDWLLPYRRGIFGRLRWGASFTRPGTTRFFTAGGGTT